MKETENVFMLRLFAATCLCLGICTTVVSDDANSLERISVDPDRLTLTGSRATAQILVTGHYSDGHVRDLTREAVYESSEIAAIRDGFVKVQSGGTDGLTVRFGNQRAKVSLSAVQLETPDPISFRWETLAILTKQGCNSGSCHGKPNGQGSLELSLNAFDPKLDERNLIRGSFVRFTEPLDPEQSLLLKKPSLRVPHGGGKRLRPGEVGYSILRQWIYEGCRPEPVDSPSCVKVEVQPKSGRLIQLTEDDGSFGRQQVRVIAHFSDGSARDVTRIATYSVSHDRIAEVDQNGLVTGLQRGQTAVIVRYLDDIVSCYLTFVNDVPGFEWNNPPENNYIDRLVNQRLSQLQFLPSEISNDGDFIRRLSLDVRGLLPSVAETTAFLADDSADKRSRLIDRFLGAPEYARFWGMKMADLLRINSENLSHERAAAYSGWVFDSVDKNIPYDRFVTELLTASGKTSEVHAANFFRVTSDTKMVTETVAQLFMGSRVMCAQCHNHPYESWTQNNYYQIGSAFHEVDRTRIASEYVDAKGRKRKRDAKDVEVEIGLTFGRAMSNPRTGVVQRAWPTNVKRTKDEDRRIAFVKWLTSPGNPYFSRVAVNRIWAHLFGSGIVNPVDDFRSSNPPVNVELLDTLANDFEDSGFDRKTLMRRILNSRTYQLSSESNAFNESDDELFSHARVRMLSAEQMEDAIRRLCDGSRGYVELENQLATAEEELLAIQKRDIDAADEKQIKVATKQRDAAKSKLDGYYMTQQPYPRLTPFLKAFGQPERKTACACERRTEASLDQALQLMNSSLIRGQVARAARRLQSQKGAEFAGHVYLAAFSRRPTASEQSTVEKFIATATDRGQAIEDVIWALINTNEFMFQH